FSYFPAGRVSLSSSLIVPHFPFPRDFAYVIPGTYATFLRRFQSAILLVAGREFFSHSPSHLPHGGTGRLLIYSHSFYHAALCCYPQGSQRQLLGDPPRVFHIFHSFAACGVCP